MSGMGNGSGVSPCALNDRISAYDFALWEMTLYLDTHPNDGAAMELTEAYRRKRQELTEWYEGQFGPRTILSSEVAGDRWDWVNSPWPWEGKE